MITRPAEHSQVWRVVVNTFPQRSSHSVLTSPDEAFLSHTNFIKPDQRAWVSSQSSFSTVHTSASAFPMRLPWAHQWVACQTENTVQASQTWGFPCAGELAESSGKASGQEPASCSPLDNCKKERETTWKCLLENSKAVSLTFLLDIWSANSSTWCGVLLIIYIFANNTTSKQLAVSRFRTMKSSHFSTTSWKESDN